MAGTEYGAVQARNLMVAMRDGVNLATDVYRPAVGADPAPGRFPTILVRTPYDKGNQNTSKRQGDYFARRGYNVVIQDVRGRYESAGEFYFVAREAEDGYDTMVWLADQPWHNGKVGTMGTSYLAWVQSALASLNPPGLAAMFVNQGGHNAYTSTVRHNGAFEMRFFAWAFMGVATSPEAVANPLLRTAFLDPAARASDWLGPTAPKEGRTPLALAPSYERWAFDLMTRGDDDGEFWHGPSLNFAAHLDRHSDVPIMFSSAWYDSYTRANMENFVAFSRAKKGPIRALMGPWTHGSDTLDRTWSGDVEFGPAASVKANLAADVNDLHLRWFDHWLKGVDNGVAAEPPIRLFVMGGGDGHRTPEGRLFHGGAWRHEREWPLARTRFTPFYLSPGRLSPAKPASASDSTSFRYDPLDPVPTIGGNISSLSEFFPVPAEIADKVAPEARWGSIVRVGGQDQRTGPDTFGATPPHRPLAARADVLVFETEPLAEPVELTGPLTAKLWVASTAPDTDITVKLVDVYPPSADYPHGYALNISDSIQRLRYRHGDGRPAFLTPGEAVPVEIEMYPTSNVFGRGHRIRLDVSSSNFPRFDVNPNTGEPVGRHTRIEVAVNTVHHDAAHPSHIVLPVIPAG